ncbi:MAG: hypothetical protein K8T25_04575 [Planctomycetia bacterium]|nr:hypothetical protein [Planctomycetia bacterium]
MQTIQLSDILTAELRKFESLEAAFMPLALRGDLDAARFVLRVSEMRLRVLRVAQQEASPKSPAASTTAASPTSSSPKPPASAPSAPKPPRPAVFPLLTPELLASLSPQTRAFLRDQQAREAREDDGLEDDEYDNEEYDDEYEDDDDESDDWGDDSAEPLNAGDSNPSGATVSPPRAVDDLPAAESGATGNLPAAPPGGVSNLSAAPSGAMGSLPALACDGPVDESATSSSNSPIVAALNHNEIPVATPDNAPAAVPSLGGGVPPNLDNEEVRTLWADIVSLEAECAKIAHKRPPPR